MALRLEVVVLPRVAPGHGACTVPVKGWQAMHGQVPQTWAGICGIGVRSSAYEGRSWGCSPGDVQEDQALGLQVLDLGGQVCPITLETTQGCSGCCKGGPGPPYPLWRKWPPPSAPYSDCPPSQGKLMLPGTHPLPNPETLSVPRDRSSRLHSSPSSLAQSTPAHSQPA